TVEKNLEARRRHNYRYARSLALRSARSAGLLRIAALRCVVSTMRQAASLSIPHPFRFEGAGMAQLALRERNPLDTFLRRGFVVALLLSMSVRVFAAGVTLAWD